MMRTVLLSSCTTIGWSPGGYFKIPGHGKVSAMMQQERRRDPCDPAWRYPQKPAWTWPAYPQQGHRHGFVLALGVLSMVLAFGTARATTDSPATDTSFESMLAPCAQSFQRGALHQAVSCWSETVRRAEREQRAKVQRVALTHMAQAYQALGHDRKAVESLAAALVLAQRERPLDEAQIAALLGSLGNAYIATGPATTAATYLHQALELARKLDQPGLLAVILNNLGNLLVSQQKPHEALEAYRESVARAKDGKQYAMMVRALTNAARVALQEEQFQESKALLDEAWARIQELAPSHETAYGFLSLGLTSHSLRPHLSAARDALLLLAAAAFRKAIGMAQTLGDLRAASYAWGYLGSLYETEHRYEEAQQLTQHAVFAAQQVHAPEILYRWQWQTGRLLTALGHIDAAIATYQRAVETLQSLRVELPYSYGEPTVSFRAHVGPVYFELVDLLLRRAAAIPEQDPQYTAHLRHARATVELFKAAELRDYFQDDCVEAAEQRITPLDVISQQAVVVYPILLPDRLELLVNLPTGLKRYAVAVTAATLERTARRFRERLQQRTRRYLRDAQELYDWLIRPFAVALQSFPVETLVFVPDGVLRTIPMAALHDGEQFLVQKYALAVTPGLDLTDPRPMTQRNVRILAGGLTHAVQDQPSLPYVEAEIEAILHLYEGTVLLNEDFRLARLEQTLQRRPFGIVHIASHGYFARDVAQSFILAADQKLTMNDLEQLVGRTRFREEPIELLTLSACETALGDDRAALGLAGVAVKAGARSALATLWRVHDQAAAELVEAFYRQLREPTNSRAVALQRAQLHLLQDSHLHPFFWAPFLLINTWL
jgi:CHAT domain-containing protein/Tfp pilus assembly protein PilF